MNKPLDFSIFAALELIATADLDSVIAAHKAGKTKRHSKPFAKRDEGRDRRAARREKQARRFDWFNQD